MPSRLEKRAEEEAAIAAMYPHVMPGWLPTPTQHRSWSAWVVWEDGASDVGEFIGYCPLHDPDKALEASAEFNFRKGVVRCNGEEPCFPNLARPGHYRRVCSLVNLTTMMLSRAGTE